MRDVSLRKHPREFANSDGLIHRMRITFGGASRAKLNGAEGKKIEGWLSEGSIFRAKATLFDPSGRLVPRTLRTRVYSTCVCTRNTLVGGMFMAQREYSIQ